jgi:hypothetical protein
VSLTVGELTAYLKLEDRDYNRSLDSAHSKFSGFASSVGKFAVMAGGALAALGTGMAARGIWDATEAASDLNETVSKSSVVFGKSAKAVEEFGNQASDSMGQSKEQAIGAAATFGNLMVSAGLAKDKAAEMSMGMVQLASDLASFNNTPVDDALEALRSGLVGESEPLKRFGVNLNEATLKAKALELGLSDGKSVLDANAKAQAAYALVMEQTGTAQGDFARTSDGLANSQRTVTATLQDAKAALGGAFLPIVVEALPRVKEMANWVKDLATGFTDLAKAQGLKVAFKGLFGRIADVLANVDWSKVGTAVVDAISTAVDTLAPVVVDVAVNLVKGGAKGLPGFAKENFEWFTGIGVLVTAIHDMSGELDASIVHINGRWYPAVYAASEATGLWAAALGMLAPSLQQLADNQEAAYILQLKNIGVETQTVTTTSDVWGRVLGDLGTAWTGTNEIAEAYAEHISDMADGFKKLYVDTVDPMAAWKTAVDKTGAASEIAAGNYTHAKQTFTEYIEELKRQLAEWGDFESELRLVAVEWGPKFGSAVIEELAKQGEPNLRAFLGLDDETQAQALTLLQQYITTDMTSLSEMIDKYSKEAGADGGLLAALEWVRAFTENAKVTLTLDGALTLAKWQRYYSSTGSAHANGTITHGPEVALIGEAGPEVVLPLNNRRRTMELLSQSGLLHAFAQGGVVANDAGYMSRIIADGSAGFGAEELRLILEAFGSEVLIGALGNRDKLGMLYSAAQRMSAMGVSLAPVPQDAVTGGEGDARGGEGKAIGVTDTDALAELGNIKDAVKALDKNQGQEGEKTTDLLADIRDGVWAVVGASGGTKRDYSASKNAVGRAR